MTEDDFRKLCNTFGFAPSRALRELIDCATARAEAQRDALLEALWVCMEHNRLHYGDSHNTVIQARAAIKQAEGENT